jgi:hypothetical protein
MPEIPPELEQLAASMSDDDWQVFTAKVRAPDNAEAFRAAASKVIDGDRLEAICRVASIGQYVGDDGQIDEAKVINSMRAVFGIPAGPQWQDFGQHTESPDMGGPGDRGRAEAQKRFDGNQSQRPGMGRGREGYDEAVRRGYVANGTENKS